jgi:uncharacterized protein
VQALQTNANELKRFGVRKIALFGSFANGTARSHSDIDLLVSLEEESFDKYFDLKFFLEDLFKRKVDLVLESQLKPALAYVREEAIYA